MAIGFAYGPHDVTVRNPVGLIYFKGAVAELEAWRAIVIDLPDKLSFQHFEPLNETNIDLDEAHVTSIENNPIYTANDPYFASVLTDTRVDQNLPAGLAGDQVGRFIEWDGFVWQSFVEQWVEKGKFEESFFSDRGIFQRMTLIETDPNDPTRHPPQPPQGTTIGARNTQFDDNGIEVVSFNDKDGHFGSFLEMLHGPDAQLIDQATSVRVNGSLLGFPYEDAWVEGTDYSIGDPLVDQGKRYECIVNGVQVGTFADNITSWAIVDSNFRVDTILTSQFHEVLVNQFGNVLVSEL